MPHHQTPAEVVWMQSAPPAVVTTVALLLAFGGTAVALPGKSTATPATSRTTTCSAVDIKDGNLLSAGLVDGRRRPRRPRLRLPPYVAVADARSPCLDAADRRAPPKTSVTRSGGTTVHVHRTMRPIGAKAFVMALGSSGAVRGKDLERRRLGAGLGVGGLGLGFVVAAAGQGRIAR